MKKKNKTEKKVISPFKEKDLLKKEITDFINKYKSTVKNQAKRISDFFEMSCFNHIVSFYENNGYVVKIENLQKNQYRYKCTPSGIQSNFSYFSVEKKIKNKNYSFEIQHNLAVQSSHSNEIFTTPDIVVIKKDKVKYTKNYYDTQRTFSYVENEDFITFFEVKQFNPFPELLFNFIGVVNELRKDIMTKSEKKIKPKHLAPSLMVSGKPSKPTQKIKEELEERYNINIIFDIFDKGKEIFSKTNINKLKTTNKNTTNS